MKTSLITLALCALALMGCAGMPPLIVPSPAAESVTGTVTYLVRSALPPNAIVNVQLQDISLADAPATVISAQTIETGGKQVPFPYELPYDPAQIQSNHRYAVRAQITLDGKLLFTSTQTYLVITAGNPTKDVEIVVQPV
jgi:putative lipoprotein